MTSISMIVKSHLSDLAIETGNINTPGFISSTGLPVADAVKVRLNFISFLLHNYSDTRVTLDEDQIDAYWDTAQFHANITKPV